MFAVNTTAIEYECRISPTIPFEKCNITDICAKRALNIDGFEYHPNKQSGDYFYNWFQKYDMLCKDESAIGQIAGLYFIGYLFGIVFFFLPN